MDEASIEETFSDQDSSDGYEREQLEIALYSQIHFEENEGKLEDPENCGNNNNNVDFFIDVKGNERKGFVATETNASIILNRGIDTLYGELQEPNTHESREKGLFKASSTSEKDKSKTKPSQKAAKLVKTASLENAKKEINQAKKIQSLVRTSSKSDRKQRNVEKMILGCTSDNDDLIDICGDGDMIDLGDDDDDDEVEEVDVSSDEDKNVKFLLDTDEDSLDAVLGESDSGTEDIQMNVHSNLRYSYRKMAHEESGIVADEDNVDDAGDWVISGEDSFKDLRSAVSKGRYYKPVRCHNCNHVGHLSKNCPQPKKVVVCSLCSDSGHISRNCPQSMCFNCEEPGHDVKSCRAPRRKIHAACYRCDMPGHDQNQCPDIWRQYHITITPGKIQQLFIEELQRNPSCYNCGVDGHFGHECEENRMNKFVRVNTPFICRYNTPAQIKQMEVRYDEVPDERPLKKSRSDSWLESRDYRNTRDKFDNRGDSYYKNKYNDRGGETTNVSNNNFKKPSRFAHIAKNRSEIELSTGRNNFDKLQFTVLNKKKFDKRKENDFAESITETKRKKPKKKKRKEKNKSEAFNTVQSNVDVLTNSGEAQHSETSSQGTSQQQYSNAKKRKVDFYIDTNFEPNSNRDFNEVFATSGQNFDNQRQVTFNENDNKAPSNKRKRNKNKGKTFIDLTIETKPPSNPNRGGADFTEMKYSSERNDSLRPDDLFSLQKIRKLQSGSNCDMPDMTGDIEHQVMASSASRKRKNKRKKKKNTNFEC